MVATVISLILISTANRLRLPNRPASATGGGLFANSIEALNPKDRESAILKEVLSGNVPDFLRTLCPVRVVDQISHQSGTIYVTPDYLAVGSDTDYLMVPVTPYTAQKIADRLGGLLPTPKMVDDIYGAAQVKLEPSPIPPSRAMTTVPIFVQHSQAVAAQRDALTGSWRLGTLTAGDKKDIVICAGLRSRPDRVAIYGWHKTDGHPIQPLYLGHFDYWADYSHGVRFISKQMEVDGKLVSLEKVLRDPKLCGLVSNEGPVTQPRYRIKEFPLPKALPKVPKSAGISPGVVPKGQPR